MCILSVLARSIAVLLVANVNLAQGAACVPPRPAESRDCFTKADNAKLPFRVFQTSATPPSARLAVCDSATSPYFPATDFLGGTGKVNEQDPRYASYYLHWINRCQYLKGITPTENDCRFKRDANGNAKNITPKGNSYENSEPFARLEDQVRAAFSTYEKADGCSELQEMQLLDYSDGAIDALAAKVGLSLYRNADRTKATLGKLLQDVTLADGKRWRYLVNMCVLPTKGLAKAFTGLGMDYEVNDNRTEAESTSFLNAYAAKAHQANKLVALAANPLPRVASGLSGQSVYRLLDTIDSFFLTTSNGASPGNLAVGNKPSAARQTIMQSYIQQLAIVTDNGQRTLSPQQKKHMFWSVPLYQVGLEDAQQMHDVIQKEGYGGLSIFRNYQKQGGACTRDTNQLTACLTLGMCDGTFGINRPQSQN